MDPKQDLPPLHLWPWTQEMYKKLSNANPGSDFNNALYHCLQNNNIPFNLPQNSVFRKPNGQNKNIDSRAFNTDRNGYLQGVSQETDALNNLQAMIHDERSRFLHSNEKNKNKGRTANCKKPFFDNNSMHKGRPSNMLHNREMTVHNVYNYFNVNSPHIYNMYPRDNFHASYPEGERCLPPFLRKHGQPNYDAFYGKENSLISNASPESYAENQPSKSLNQSFKDTNVSRWYKLPETSSIDQGMNDTQSTVSDSLSMSDDGQCITTGKIWSTDNFRQSPEYSSSTTSSRTTPSNEEHAIPGQLETGAFHLFNLSPNTSVGQIQNTCTSSLMNTAPLHQSLNIPVPTRRHASVNMNVNQCGNNERTFPTVSSPPPPPPPLDYSSSSQMHKRHYSGDRIDTTSRTSYSTARCSRNDVDLLNLSYDCEGPENRTSKRKSDDSLGFNVKRRISESLDPDNLSNIQNITFSGQSHFTNENQYQQMARPCSSLSAETERSRKTAYTISEIQSTPSLNLSTERNEYELSRLGHTARSNTCNNTGNDSYSETLRLPLKVASNPAPNSSHESAKSQQLVTYEKRKRKSIPKQRLSLSSPSAFNPGNTHTSSSCTVSNQTDSHRNYGLKLPVLVKPAERNPIKNNMDKEQISQFQNPVLSDTSDVASESPESLLAAYLQNDINVSNNINSKHVAHRSTDFQKDLFGEEGGGKESQEGDFNISSDTNGNAEDFQQKNYHRHEDEPHQEKSSALLPDDEVHTSVSNSKDNNENVNANDKNSETSPKLPQCTLKVGSTQYNGFTFRYIFLDDHKYFLLDDIKAAFSQTLIDSALSYSSLNALCTCDENMVKVLSKHDPYRPAPKPGCSKLISEDIYSNLMMLSVFVKEVYSTYKKDKESDSILAQKDTGDSTTTTGDNSERCYSEISKEKDFQSGQNVTSVKSESVEKENSNINLSDTLKRSDERRSEASSDSAISDDQVITIEDDDDDDDDDVDDDAVDDNEKGNVEEDYDSNLSSPKEPIMTENKEKPGCSASVDKSTERTTGKKKTKIKQKKRCSDTIYTNISKKKKSRTQQKIVKFVGRGISHEWIINEETGEKQAYNGFVSGVVEGRDGGTGTIYEVFYEGEECSYEVADLLLDLEEGTLKFIDVPKALLPQEPKQCSADINKKNIQDNKIENSLDSPASKSEAESESSFSMFDAYHLSDNECSQDSKNREPEEKDEITETSEAESESSFLMLDAYQLSDNECSQDSKNSEPEEKDEITETSSVSDSENQLENQPEKEENNSKAKETNKRERNIEFFNKQLRVVLKDCLNKKLICPRKPEKKEAKTSNKSFTDEVTTNSCDDLRTSGESDLFTKTSNNNNNEKSESMRELES